ncbi:MAG: hypothetical protein Q4D98_02750 [Planctomycetia bacterium]|nr:hypothetical protein [Planctomycetia bacterium]
MDMREQLATTLAEIQKNGWTLREEWMDGNGGGCILHGKKFFFSDQSLRLPDRLQVALDFLEELRSTPHPNASNPSGHERP